MSETTIQAPEGDLRWRWLRNPQQFIFAGLLLTISSGSRSTSSTGRRFLSDFIEIRRSSKNNQGEKFKKLIKQKGVHAPGQHANKEFRAALRWLCDLGAITEDEFNNIERIYALRNDIGHELFQIIADDNKSPIRLDDVLTTFSVYLKVVRWWVRKVEADRSGFRQENTTHQLGRV
jgi:hypothetical protein